MLIALRHYYFAMYKHLWYKPAHLCIINRPSQIMSIFFQICYLVATQVQLTTFLDNTSVVVVIIDGIII